MKRFLFIFTLVVSLVLPAASSVYAADALPSFDLPAIPDDYPFEYYFVIYYSYTANSGYVITGSNSPFFYNGQVLCNSDYCESWQYTSSSTEWNRNYFSYDANEMKYSTVNLYSSSHDIYYEDGVTVFFQLPQPVLGMEKEILAQVITQENPLKEILTLLPMAIPCLVGFVALRKALRILGTILKTA